MSTFIKKKSSGFTLMESIISIAIFLILADVTYKTLSTISKQAALNRESASISNLADQYLENARNIPYAQIGTVMGNPNGTLPDSTTPVNVTLGSGSYQVYYEVTYLDDAADGTAVLGTDFAPQDYKQVKLSVKNVTTNTVTKFITNIAPSGLENMVNGGALVISVIDAVGQPVPNATVNITNTALNPDINLTRTTDSTGHWVEVGLPVSSNSYHVTITKTGYSTDQTYPVSIQNPDPIKEDATISDGQVTQISFAIDRTSTLTFKTLDQTCQPIANIVMGIRGAKLIGTPDVHKFDSSYTSNGSGQVLISNAEWDNYTPGLAIGSYMAYGSSPIQEINLFPNTNQTFSFILGPSTPYSMLVIIKDSSTNNPVDGATVHLTNTSTDPETDETFITGGSLLNQEFWNGGSGQESISDKTKYYSDDGNIDTSTVPLAVRLKSSDGVTLSNSGELTSSTFDTGSGDTTYTTFIWQPGSQDPAATVKFQLATNNDNSTWNFVGPDGTNNTYYTTPGSSISSSNNAKRYLRYKAFLSTTDTTKNPTLTSVGINYVSGCFTPGQVMFPDLENDSNYTLEVSMPGYVTKTVEDIEVNKQELIEIPLNAN